MTEKPRRIVLTGVSRGLGRAMLEGFAATGHTVFGCARSAAAVEELRRTFGAPHQFAVVDVTDEAQVRAWADEVLAAGVVPDLLINNAAVMEPTGSLWEIPPDQFTRLVQVNVNGVFYVTRHFLPAMVRAGVGVVVNFSSGRGRSVAAKIAPYCASKWAIEGLTGSLAAELPEGMAAVPLNPGIIFTDMLRISFGEDAANYPPPAEWAQRAVPFILALGPEQNGQSLTVPS